MDVRPQPSTGMNLALHAGPSRRSRFRHTIAAPHAVSRRGQDRATVESDLGSLMSCC
jgi:hypothetical protein